MMKEVKASERSLKKRNAAGANAEIENESNNNSNYDNCLEYATKLKKIASKEKKLCTITQIQLDFSRWHKKNVKSHLKLICKIKGTKTS